VHPCTGAQLITVQTILQKVYNVELSVQILQELQNEYYILLVRDEVFSGVWVWILFLNAWNDATIATSFIIRLIKLLHRKHFPLQAHKQQLEEIG